MDVTLLDPVNHIFRNLETDAILGLVSKRIPRLRPMKHDIGKNWLGISSFAFA